LCTHLSYLSCHHIILENRDINKDCKSFSTMQKKKGGGQIFISNFRLVVNVVLFLLGDSRASEFYVPTFRKTLFRLIGSASKNLVHTTYEGT